MRKFYTWFFVVNLLLSIFYIDLWTNGNTTSRALPIVSWFENGNLKINKYHEKTEDKAFVNANYYSDKAPLPTYLVMPFFWVLKSTGMIQPDEKGSYFGKPVYALGDILAGTLPFVLILLLIFMDIRKYNSHISPVWLALIPFYASFIFVFTGTYFAHILSGLLLLLSYIKLKKEQYIWSGFYAGLSFLCEYNLALIFLLWGLLIIIRTRKIRPFLKYSAAILPSIIFIMIYNYVITGSPFDMLYKFHTYTELHKDYGFSHPSLESLWGLTVSNYKGILFYMPVLFIVLFFSVRKMINYGYSKILGHYLFIPVIIYFLVIASYFGWWGGWTYGPRLLTGIAILLIYEGIVLLSKRKFSKIVFWIFSGFGLIGAFLAKATVVYSVPTDVKNPFIDLIIPNLIEGRFNENNLLTIFFQTSPKASFFVFIILFCLLMTSLYLWYESIKKTNRMV